MPTSETRTESRLRRQRSRIRRWWSLTIEHARYRTHREGRRIYSRATLDAFTQRSPPSIARVPIAYCQVSSAAQKADMKNRRRILEDFCAARGVANTEFIEVGGGLNFKRPKFVATMDRVESRQVSHLIVAHKDRLIRFGSPLQQAALADTDFCAPPPTL
jgi:predicted site-specific integrase-resolvase